jgi:hypothetical protein
MFLLKYRLVHYALFACLLSFQAAADQVKPNHDILSQTRQNAEELITLTFSNDVRIEVEYANDPQTRALGLMYRREMCDNCGMLFKFDSVKIASIWMKNTYIPLDLAYINAFGKVVDIKPLKPHDLTSVPSPVPVLYALEMNQGWFAENKIAIGDTVKLPSYIK